VLKQLHMSFLGEDIASVSYGRILT